MQDDQRSQDQSSILIKAHKFLSKSKKQNNRRSPKSATFVNRLDDNLYIFKSCSDEEEDSDDDENVDKNSNSKSFGQSFNDDSKAEMFSSSKKKS